MRSGGSSRLGYAALALPVALGTAAAGALAMILFGLGTVPALALLAAGVAKFLRRGLWPRRLLAIGLLVVGLFSIAVREGWMDSNGAAAGRHQVHPTAQ